VLADCLGERMTGRGLLIIQWFVYTFDTNGIEWSTRSGSHD